MALTVILLSIPAVQTVIAKKVTRELNESYGTDIQIERLGLNWKGQVDIRGILISDHHQDTLIAVRKLNTTVLSVRNLMNDDFDFGGIDLYEAKLHLTTYKDEDDDNLNIFVSKFDSDGPKSEEIFQLFSNYVTLENSEFRVVDQNLEKPLVIHYTQLYLDVDDFSIYDEDIEADVNRLALEAKAGYAIREFQGDFSYNSRRLKVNKMIAKTQFSEIRGDVLLDYAETGMSDFENNVVFTADLRNSKISTNDLNTYYGEFGKDIDINLTGLLKGTLNDFVVENTQIRTNSTQIRGRFSFKNLLNEEEPIYLEGRNHSIRTNYYDLGRLLPQLLGTILPREMKELGSFTLNGTTSMLADEIKTDSKLNSPLGQSDIKVTIGNINNFENAYYRGDITLDEFDLGRLSGTASLKTVSANLFVDGRGFSKEAVNTRVDGTVSSIIFNNYPYKNIQLAGRFEHPVFNGELVIDDPNLKMTFDGLVDISREINQYDFTAKVDYAELNKLNLFTRDSVSIFAGRVVMDMAGTTINDAEGTIEFEETFYQSEVDDYYFDDFLITASTDGNDRVLEIRSPDIVNGRIRGRFLVEDIPNLFRNGIGSIYANYIPNEVTSDQYIDYEFEIYNKIVEVFVPSIQLGENTKVRGLVYSDESKFKLNFRSPEIIVYDRYLEKINIQVDNNNPLFNTFISVDSVDAGFYGISKLSLINKTLNDTLYIRSEFQGGKNNEDLFNLSLYHTINPEGKSVVGMKRSDITYKDNVWYLNKNNNSRNKIVFDNNFKDIRIDSLVLNHQDEFIRMAGEFRGNDYKDLKVRLTDVNIGNIGPDIDSLRLRGNINGNLHFLQKEGAYFPTSSIRIDGVAVNDVDYGNLNININGNEDLSRYDIDSRLFNNEITMFSAVGSIDVVPEVPQFDMDVKLERFNLEAISPFGGEVITDIRGFISGNIKVTGAYKSPDLAGRLFLNDSGMKIPYLNTDFDLATNTAIFVSKNKFSLGQTSITDTKYDTSGALSGNITHTNFSRWNLDLSISTDRMLVLDTPPDEDELYYGTAFISGEADIRGPVNELVINATATTEEGTSFKIPISDIESIGNDSFIHFLSPEEKRAIIEGVEVVPEQLRGLTLNFDLDINENAEVEVLVDQVNNSNLRGRGAGTLLIRINTLGRFDMWGDFLVIDGEYDFRYGGLVTKTFDVIPGGNITWDGDPSGAQINISARYQTRANPSVLLDNPSVNRKIPVDVVIDLSGDILQPNLDFQLEFPETSSTLRSELEYKLQNSDERQSQALFLISTNSFKGDQGAFQNALSGAIVAERINSLVADLFSDTDSKFKVLPYYEAGSRTIDQETADQFGVSLSTQISERILINGKVGVPVGGVTETQVAGDIEVQWLVNEDGSLRMNFFNRQADIQFIGQEQIFEQGAGVSYSVDFDTFKELAEKLFNKKLTIESEDESTVVPDDNNYPVNFKSKKDNNN